jgi:hypothetical protein
MSRFILLAVMEHRDVRQSGKLFADIWSAQRRQTTHSSLLSSTTYWSSFHYYACKTVESSHSGLFLMVVVTLGNTWMLTNVYWSPAVYRSLTNAFRICFEKVTVSGFPGHAGLTWVALAGDTKWKVILPSWGDRVAKLPSKPVKSFYTDFPNSYPQATRIGWQAPAPIPFPRMGSTCCPPAVRPELLSLWCPGPVTELAVAFWRVPGHILLCRGVAALWCSASVSLSPHLPGAVGSRWSSRYAGSRQPTCLMSTSVGEAPQRMCHSQPQLR